MWTNLKLKIILYLVIWRILFAASFDGNYSTKFQIPNTNRPQFNILNFYPALSHFSKTDEEVYITNQTLNNNTIFISQKSNPDSNSHPEPQPQPQPQPPPQPQLQPQPHPEPEPEPESELLPQPQPQPNPSPHTDQSGLNPKCPPCLPCNCPPCPECVCPPCPQYNSCNCPPCQCPEKPTKIRVEETYEYEEEVVEHKMG